MTMVLAFAASLGCPGKSDGETDGATTESTTETATTDVETSDSTTDTETTGERVCPCIADDPPGEWGDVPSAPLCGEDVCPTVQAGSNSCSFVNVSVSNPDALECALTALRDRTPGIVRWSCNTEADQFHEDGYILILDDGTAIRRKWGQEDLGYSASDAEHGALPDPGEFDDCLAGGTDDRYRCLTSLMVGQPMEVCDEYWQVSSGI